MRLAGLELALPSNGCVYARRPRSHRRNGTGAAAGEPAQERDWRGGGVAAGGGVYEAVVVGGSVQVGDVLLGGDVGDLGMHGLTSCWVVVRAL